MEKLAEITKRRGATNMREVAMRLRVSRRRSETEACNEGFEAGKAWAMSRAEADELERLADLKARELNRWDAIFCQDRQAYSVAERMAFVIVGLDDVNDRAEAREFWETALGKQVEKLQPEFVRGFVDGTLHIWDGVAHEL